MDEKKKRRRRRGIAIASAALVISLVGFMLWCVITERYEAYLYHSALGIFVLLYCFLLDYLEPKLCGEFDGISTEQKRAYQKFAVLDAAGYLGLAFFLVTLGNWNNLGLIGLAVYLLGLKPKKDARNFFYGLDAEEDKEVKKSVLTEDDPAWLRAFEEEPSGKKAEKKDRHFFRKSEGHPDKGTADTEKEEPALTETSHSCKIIQMPVRRAEKPDGTGKK